MTEKAQRRHLVRACLHLTRGTTLAADCYEMRLLVQFIQGEWTIDQVCELLDARLPLLGAA